MKSYWYLSLFLLLLGCIAPDSQNQDAAHGLMDEKTLEPARDYPLLLQKLLGAHGGLSTWKQYQSLEFDLNSELGDKSSSQHSVVDLKNRYERIRYAEYEMGYNGGTYWYHADSIPKDHPDPKFYINLQFYFFALPFVIADPGTNYEVLEPRTLDGKTYEILKVSYREDIGVAPKDQYVLYIDPETYQLHLLLYSVTYFNAENTEKYNALLYEAWQTEQGLLMPLRMANYVWDQESQELGERQGQKEFSNVEFSKAPPPKSLFDMPEGV